MTKKKDPPTVSEEDRRLFLKAMGVPESGRTPIESVTKGPRVKPEDDRVKPEVDKVSASETHEDSLFLRALNESFSSPEFKQKQRDSVASKSPKPKAAARPSGPDAAIDLHACSLEQALRRTEDFLIHAHAKKYRKVLIIHGKGSGILKEGVRKYLMHHALVAQMDEAEKQHGGSGAVMVILRR